MIMQPISAKSLDLFTSRSKTWSWVYVQASLAPWPVSSTSRPRMRINHRCFTARTCTVLPLLVNCTESVLEVVGFGQGKCHGALRVPTLPSAKNASFLVTGFLVRMRAGEIRDTTCIQETSHSKWTTSMRIDIFCAQKFHVGKIAGLSCFTCQPRVLLQISHYRFILKKSGLKRQISSLVLRLEDASIDTPIRAIVVELRVGDLQGHFSSVADNLLAPELPWPITAQEARRSVTSLPSSHSLAPKFFEPIRALRFPGD
jgi:hypothetical protein